VKKRIVAVLIFAILLSGCSKSHPSADMPSKTTIMLYMIGSDLEAKAGAATRDLQEIAESGVDTSLVNVIVYAGGSPYWHNDTASAEDHTLLYLTDNGFAEISAVPSFSMGDPNCLSAFLNYAYEAFPADQYGLILWDHGNGPVIGYGKDMLFGNDALTLPEMEQALKNTPFVTEKLDWVGFDACLMASAELSSVWASYADYLVASQEVEPALGWDYSFLGQAGRTDTVILLQTLTSDYLNTCMEYYEDRGYEHRDTTLSCVDLSKATALQYAINDLFRAASANIAEDYNTLAARRVQTRALGRATTGSEYDLIDLSDLAQQLKDLYPQQAERLQQVLKNMVIANAANTENCSGLSLYYPFYNKYYFQDSWWESYEKLSVLPDYLNYLKEYQAIWLKDDLLDDASSATPHQTPIGTYTLQLTPAQQESFASAKYYILARNGEEYYTRIFESPDVTNENGLLTAGFDGNVLYVSNDFCNYQIPVTIAHDTVGDQSRYSVFVTLTNYSLSMSALSEGFEPQLQAHRFSLTLNRKTDMVSVSALVPYDHETGAEILTGGKLEETDLSQWESCFFRHDDHRYLTRYENGAIMPVDQWTASTLFSGYEFPIEDGLYFTYEPLAAGDYYLLFEVEDTQGNRYCSELLPIETAGTLELPEPSDPVDITWDTGDRVLLTDQNSVSVWLHRSTDINGEDIYRLEASNRNDFPIRVLAEDLFWGADVYCAEFLSSVSLKPGETAVAKTGNDFGAAAELELLPMGNQMQLSLTVQNQLTGAHLMYGQPFRITVSDSTRIHADQVSQKYGGFHTPVLGILAKEQILLQTENVRVTLLGLGGNGIDSTLRGALCIENLTDLPLQLIPDGLVLNGVYADLHGNESPIPARSRVYRYFDLLESVRKTNGITAVETAQLLLKETVYSPLFTGNQAKSLTWCPIELSQCTPASKFPGDGQIIFEENGIRVRLIDATTNKTSRTWQLALENNTQQDIALNLTDLQINGKPVLPEESHLHLSYAQAGAQQRTMMELKHYYLEDPLESVDFRFRILDFNREAILFTGANIITLS